MAYRVTFKGNVPETTISEAAGKRLYGLWMSDKMPRRVELEDGFAVSSDAIKSIERVAGALEGKTSPIRTAEDIQRFEQAMLLSYLTDGGLTRQAEERFLADQGAVKVAANGTLVVRDGRQFAELSDWLSAWELSRGSLSWEKHRRQVAAIKQKLAAQLRATK